MTVASPGHPLGSGFIFCKSRWVTESRGRMPFVAFASQVVTAETRVLAAEGFLQVNEYVYVTRNGNRQLRKLSIGKYLTRSYRLCPGALRPRFPTQRCLPLRAINPEAAAPALFRESRPQGSQRSSGQDRIHIIAAIVCPECVLSRSILTRLDRSGGPWKWWSLAH